MAYDGFDNINLLAAQAAIEAEINLFENSSSGHTYTTMQGFTFQDETSVYVDFPSAYTYEE